MTRYIATITNCSTELANRIATDFNLSTWYKTVTDLPGINCKQFFKMHNATYLLHKIKNEFDYCIAPIYNINGKTISYTANHMPTGTYRGYRCSKLEINLKMFAI